MGGAINRSFISAHFSISAYFLTTQTYKRMRLLTRVYGIYAVHIYAVHIHNTPTYTSVQDGDPTMKRCGAVVGSLGGALFISCLWLLMLSTVIASAIGFLKWLDALYIISYIKIVTITLQYTPQVAYKSVIIGYFILYSRKFSRGPVSRIVD